jgi:hypothetical protein
MLNCLNKAFADGAAGNEKQAGRRGRNFGTDLEDLNAKIKRQLTVSRNLEELQETKATGFPAFSEIKDGIAGDCTENASYFDSQSNGTGITRSQKRSY